MLYFALPAKRPIPSPAVSPYVPDNWLAEQSKKASPDSAIYRASPESMTETSPHIQLHVPRWLLPDTK